MISLAKRSGVKLIACTTTMQLMGISKEQLIEEVDSLAGVATYLSAASEANVNLFI
jgi:peroxiredoxin family protein